MILITPVTGNRLEESCWAAPTTGNSEQQDRDEDLRGSQPSRNPLPPSPWREQHQDSGDDQQQDDAIPTTNDKSQRKLSPHLKPSTRFTSRSANGPRCSIAGVPGRVHVLTDC
jgi:hypothetical protein